MQTHNLSDIQSACATLPLPMLVLCQWGCFLLTTKFIKTKYAYYLRCGLHHWHKQNCLVFLLLLVSSPSRLATPGALAFFPLQWILFICVKKIKNVTWVASITFLNKAEVTLSCKRIPKDTCARYLGVTWIQFGFGKVYPVHGPPLSAIRVFITGQWGGQFTPMFLLLAKFCQRLHQKFYLVCIYFWFIQGQSVWFTNKLFTLN
jgi:hypothetical protein